MAINKKHARQTLRQLNYIPFVSGFVQFFRVAGRRTFIIFNERSCEYFNEDLEKETP